MLWSCWRTSSNRSRQGNETCKSHRNPRRQPRGRWRASPSRPRRGAAPTPSPRASRGTAPGSGSGRGGVERGGGGGLGGEARRRLLASACEGLADASPETILDRTLRDLYDGVPMEEVRKSAILAARALIEKDPAYSYVTARLLLPTIP